MRSQDGGAKDWKADQLLWSRLQKRIKPGLGWQWWRGHRREDLKIFFQVELNSSTDGFSYNKGKPSNISNMMCEN